MKKILLLVFFMEILFVSSGFASLQTDVNALRVLQRGLNKPALNEMLDNVLSVVPNVASYQVVPTSGSVVRRFDDRSHQVSGYYLRYQGDPNIPEEERLSNLVHELTHIAVDQAYGKDLTNYSNRTTKAVPAAIFGKEVSTDTFSLMRNEAARQTAQNLEPVNKKLDGNLAQLDKLVSGCNFSPAIKKKIKDKLLYGRVRPNLEYDTCINQIIVWWHIMDIPTSNNIYKKLETLVRDATTRRRTGARVN